MNARAQRLADGLATTGHTGPLGSNASSCVRQQSGFGDAWIRLGGVKLFSDGALGPRTAAMLEPYIGEPDNCGLLLLDSEELFNRGVQAAEAGFGLTVHAIGDRANREVLNAFQFLRDHEKIHGYKPHRHRIEHVQLLHKQDLSRLAELEIVASMQPIHATSDMVMADMYWGSRVSESYAWRVQLDAGAVVAFGSDAPVEYPNPFLGIHAAVTRRRQDGTPSPEGWTPAQRLTLQESLTAYTYGAAYAAELDSKQGKLLPDFYADLIVLEEDPYKMAIDDLVEVCPVATMVGGKWRFGEFVDLEL